ncbi:MFS transporter [Nonomuraea sp. 3-1Str]|uniref:MFS transporter n=1 Tax=Nonomuraea sp. 3-1Str TaxID=2929801 RepID=UPI002855A7CF|nr:MFS transporter [Nonomuraea sp. 3-1Str]MDR8412797.1 MFS transporter [Nonomuraea sp. 3-1Str]
MIARGLPAKARTSYWPGIVAAALTTTVTVMPGFTVGALGPAIEQDLRVSRTAVGLMISAFYAATALGSPIAKRAAARLPAPVVLAVAAVAACAVLLVVSQADDLATMTAALVAGGLSNGLVQPVAGRLIAARVPVRRRSLAAGTIGAALGAATIVPGLLVALVLPVHGWRTAMVAAGLIALVPVLLTPLTRLPPGPSPERVERGATARGTGGVLVLWALAAALSATGNNAVATYFVQLGTHSGLPATVTGNLLSLSALLAVAVRLAAGALTDRAPHRNPAVIIAMMLTGALGLVLIAIGTPVTFVLGAALAFSAGWGWTGLLLATTLRLVAHQAENAGHTVQIGVYSGATIAPYAFAALSDAFGYAGSALLAATAALAAAASMTAGTLLSRRLGER